VTLLVTSPSNLLSFSFFFSSFPALLYAPERNATIERVWEETLAEFEFADARGIIEAMRS
jgi:hypothetical protein